MKEGEKELKIGEGRTEAFLVYDDAFTDTSSSVYDWLKSEGFKFAGYKGSFGLRWVHVNITRKQYAYGMPGICFAQPIGNHAITLDEFKTIYEIYKKYEGKSPLVFGE